MLFTVNRDQEASPSKPFEGQLVSITSENLVMTNRKGKYFSYSLAQVVKFTRNGTACTAEDLEPGSRIHVIKGQDGKKVVTCVEVLDKDSVFAECGN